MTFSMEVRQLYTWKLLSSCLKLSTYSFVYRECGLLQNEKVRERSSVTQTPILFPCTLPNKFMDSLGQVVAGFQYCLKTWKILYTISYMHLSVSFFFSWWVISSISGQRIWLWFFFSLNQAISLNKSWYFFLSPRFVCFLLYTRTVWLYYSYGSSIYINLTIALAPKSLRKVSCRDL